MRSIPVIAALLLVAFIGDAELKAIDAIKEATKSVVEKAADAADKTAPVEEKGGVRATALHTGANIVLDKTMDALGKRFPVVQLAAPVVKKLAKPAMNAVHEKINDWNERRKNATEAQTEAPQPEEATTTTAKPVEEAQATAASTTAAPKAAEPTTEKATKGEEKEATTTTAAPTADKKDKVVEPSTEGPKGEAEVTEKPEAEQKSEGKAEGEAKSDEQGPAGDDKEKSKKSKKDSKKSKKESKKDKKEKKEE